MMDTTRKAAKLVATLLLLQMVLGPIVNFALLSPVFAPPGFLEQAPRHAVEIGTAAMLGIAIGAMSLGIAIAAWPVLRRHSEAMALWLLGIAIAALVASVIEQSHVVSMLSLANAQADAGGADAEVFRRLAAHAGAARNTAHYMGLVGGGCLAFVLYLALYRFALVPRAIAGLGIVAALLEIATVSLPFFGGRIVFALLAPLGIVHLALIVWLFAKGFADRPPAA